MTADSGTVNVVVNGVFVPGTSVIEEGVVEVTFDSISGPDATGKYTINVTATLLGDFQHTGANAEQITLDFTVNIADAQGDSASGTYTAIVIDDVPSAANDTDSVAAGSYAAATGNVITDAAAGDAGDTDTGKDTQGADSAKVSQIASNNVPANVDNTATAGVFTVNGQYGVLTINEDGSYSYARNAGTPGGVSDVFTYTLTDGDGDTDHGDADDRHWGQHAHDVTCRRRARRSTSVNEAGLPARGGEPAGSDRRRRANGIGRDDGTSPRRWTACRW